MTTEATDVNKTSKEDAAFERWLSAYNLRDWASCIGTDGKPMPVGWSKIDRHSAWQAWQGALRQGETPQPASKDRLVPAKRSAAQFLIEHYRNRPCDSDGVANCVRCRTLALARWMLQDIDRSAPETTERTDESGWLIEVELGGRPYYWKASADARCIGEFDPDPNAALRLCREKDARDLALFLSCKGTIALSDVRKIKLTEHTWPMTDLKAGERTP